MLSQTRNYSQAFYRLEYVDGGGGADAVSLAWWSGARGWVAAGALFLLARFALVWRERAISARARAPGKGFAARGVPAGCAVRREIVTIYRPVLTQPDSRLGVSRRSAEPATGAERRHSADLLPRYQQGQDSAAGVERDGLPSGQPAVAPRLHPVVELHHRATSCRRNSSLPSDTSERLR